MHILARLHFPKPGCLYLDTTYVRGEHARGMRLSRHSSANDH
jgi:hypothetical protein